MTDFSKRAAQILLDTKSVLFSIDPPYTFTSGKKSPVYTDCRRLISFPNERNELMDAAAALLTREIGESSLDYIAGGETAGIPYAAYISDRLQKPMLYVRKQPKGFGRMAQIEGHIDEDGSKNIILVEDLQTDGGSKKGFIDALRNAGATVEHSFVIFHYGIFAKSEENNKAMGVKLHSLTTWWSVFEVAKEGNYFAPEILAEVESFLHAPEAWQERHA